MANRLSKIYTRTGDDGYTGTADGSRVEKDDLLIVAMGEVDELNCQLAVFKTHSPQQFVSRIQAIQDSLFDIGAELALLKGKAPEKLDKPDIEELERSIDELNQHLLPLEEFILPGGGLAASHCHIARAVCRRVERTLVGLNKQLPLNSYTLAYINRLSDYLFVLARTITQLEGGNETYWKNEK